MTDQIEKLLNNAPCGFLSFTDDGAIAMVNYTLLKLLGYQEQELEGKSIDAILPLAGRIFCQTHFFPLLKLYNKVEEVYFSLRAKSGQNIPILVNAIRREENGTFFNDCIFIPIHQRIKYEDEILKAKKAAETAIIAQKEAEIALQLELKERLHAEQIVHQQAARERLLREMTQKIHESLDLDKIFAIATEGIRQCFQVERVGIFKFNPESHFNQGEFMAESLKIGFRSILAMPVYDHCFAEKYMPDYKQGKIYAIEDINLAGFKECHYRFLAAFDIRANLVVPVLNGDNLWGLLCVHQCSQPRYWQDFEIYFIEQIANQLAIAIQQTYLFYQVQKELTERKIIEIKLKESNSQLQLATKAKSEFLANMSHEIRTPMNGVIGMAQLLSMTTLSEEQKDFVATIRDSGEALLTIINDILDFSKIESGMLELEERPFVLKDPLKYVCNLLKKQAADKGINLTYTIDDQVPKTILGDSSRLRQIILNLVGNALKFTEKGTVSISVISNQLSAINTEKELGKYELIFSIQDTGIGINSDRLKKLFQPFTQADASISRKYGGTGLGLTISKSLVNLMGGTIWIESLGNIGGHPPPNWVLDLEKPQITGSTFYFTIQTKIASETQINLQKQREQPPPEPENNPSKLKILLAEDNKVNQKVALFTLKRIGYIADLANNGLEVLEMLEKQNYDVILMDMQMPEMDGITATKIIRQTAKSQPYIIALTANALEEDRQICLDVGMNDFISKPLVIAELTEALKKSPNH
jgi:PAS domain S-box-containing protein